VAVEKRAANADARSVCISYVSCRKVVQQLTWFLLTQSVARFLCGSWASCSISICCLTYYKFLWGALRAVGAVCRPVGRGRKSKGAGISVSLRRGRRGKGEQGEHSHCWFIVLMANTDILDLQKILWPWPWNFLAQKWSASQFYVIRATFVRALGFSRLFVSECVRDGPTDEQMYIAMLYSQLSGSNHPLNVTTSVSSGWPKNGVGEM